MKRHAAGEVTVIVLIVLALLGGGVWLAKPKWLHGDSKRANASTQTTANLATTTAKAEDATERRGAAAAASVVKIGEAAAEEPASPANDFIRREVPIALANLPAPDPAALLAAEKRKVAVMEGRLEEAAKLYGDALKRAEQLVSERNAAVTARGIAQAQREAVDRQLAEVAAERRAAEQQRAVLAVVVVLVLLLWAYAKFFSISPASAGRIAADIRAGVSPITAMDTHLAPWLHRSVHRAAKLATDPDAKTSQP